MSVFTNVQRNAAKLLMGLAATVLLAAPAFAAQPIYVEVGQTKTMRISVNVRSASVANGSTLDVIKRGGGSLALHGKSVGRTTVSVRTTEGDVYDVTVHVVPQGTSVYSAAR